MKQRVFMTMLLSIMLASISVGLYYATKTKTVLPEYIQMADHGRLEEKINTPAFELPEIEVQPKEEITIAPYYGLTEDELNLVYAIVMQEGGPTYESAEAVMSTIVNRVNNPAKWGWAGRTIIEQITYPQQYCYSLDDYWVQYLDGNVPDEVKWAVLSVLDFGPIFEYDCFRGYYLEDCEYIEGNWYFVG